MLLFFSKIGVNAAVMALSISDGMEDLTRAAFGRFGQPSKIVSDGLSDEG